MRFTRLSAHAHGPLAGDTLTPATGLTVVWGLNEAGKSSWHSAAQLAITGLSRKRGRPTKGEQQITDRRKPRNGEPWRLGAGLRLDDGDDLTVTWDLDQRVATVLDGLGRDRSNEWLTDGAPDLARIVGLDRASFPATACMSQSDLPRVHREADLLQELLQKAITSADADSTASSAIALIDQCRKDQVGVERDTSTKPLMEARRCVEATTKALSVARDAHRDRLDLLAEITERRAELADQQVARQELQAALAVAEARHRHQEAARQHHDIDALAQQVAGLTDEIDRLVRREQVLLSVRQAYVLIERWAARPTVPTLSGPSVAELSHERASLRDAPVVEAVRPSGDDPRVPVPGERRSPPARAHAITPAVMAAAGAALLGLVLGFVVHPILYLIAVAASVPILLSLRHRASPPIHEVVGGFQERLARAEAGERAGRHDALAAQLALRRGQEHQVAEAEATLAQLDHDLSVMATRLGGDADLPIGRRIEAIAAWVAHHAGGRPLLDLAHPGPDDLVRLLDGGASDGLVDTEAQLTRCRHQCHQRRQVRDEAAGQLRQLRASTTADPPVPPHRFSTSAAGSPGTARWSEAAEVCELEHGFATAPAHPEAAFALDLLPSLDELRARIDGLVHREGQLGHVVAGLEGRLQERDAPGALADPASALESHEAAARELARVRELAAVLDETRSLLVTAEERVHRDIAPRLNAAIDRWLPRIFGDRYTHVLIDPANLDVQVFAAGGAQRTDLLSQGTAEQFSLLLRVALTETLTAASGESCPLLLDDITVNFDRERTAAVLELLREVATERQVILFTQEDDVRTWADSNLSGSDALIELDGRVVA